MAGKRPGFPIDTTHPDYGYRYPLGRLGPISLCLQNFHEPDERLGLHDHPWHCLSFILAGGYRERVLVYLDPAQPEGMATRDVGHMAPGVNLIGPNTFHALTEVKPDTWTLLIHGPKLKRWGTLTVSRGKPDGPAGMVYTPHPVRDPEHPDQVLDE